jgi:hypothetical protein
MLSTNGHSPKKKRVILYAQVATEKQAGSVASTGWPSKQKLLGAGRGEA